MNIIFQFPKVFCFYLLNFTAWLFTDHLLLKEIKIDLYLLEKLLKNFKKNTS